MPPQAGVIVMQEIGAPPELAVHCSEVLATIFTRLGAVGLVTDSVVRDILEVCTIGMNYFACGAVVSKPPARPGRPANRPASARWGTGRG